MTLFKPSSQLNQQLSSLGAELFTLFFNSCFLLFQMPNSSIPQSEGSPGPWIVPICQAASLRSVQLLDTLRSVQVLERLQWSYIDLLIPSSDKAVVSPYIVFSITICFSYFFFLLGSKILRRTSDLPRGPRDLPVLGSLLRLREARTDPVKFAGFVNLVLAHSDL